MFRHSGGGTPLKQQCSTTRSPNVIAYPGSSPHRSPTTRVINTDAVSYPVHGPVPHVYGDLRTCVHDDGVGVGCMFVDIRGLVASECVYVHVPLYDDAHTTDDSDAYGVVRGDDDATWAIHDADACDGPFDGDDVGCVRGGGVGVDLCVSDGAMVLMWICMTMCLVMSAWMNIAMIMKMLMR